MTTEDDIKDEPKAADETGTEGQASLADPKAGSSSLARRPDDAGSDPADRSEGDDEEDESAGAPTQLGSQRFVYAAYFAGGIAVAFLLSKAITYGWTRLAMWKPQLGEPHDEVVMPAAAIAGTLVAYYYYRDAKTRTLAEEVASELGKVSWPSRDEVVNSTFVVIVTTFVATIFFALMDRFWGFVTNLVYGA
jgi:preprotein translocase subunit SecE